MICAMFLLLVLAVMFFVGFAITGALFSAIFWLCFKLPVALVLWSIGIVCCCTIILIPCGLFLFKTGLALLVPGHLI